MLVIGSLLSTKKREVGGQESEVTQSTKGANRRECSKVGWLW